MTRLEYINIVLAEALDRGTISGKQAARVLRQCSAAIGNAPEPECDRDLERAHTFIGRHHNHMLGQTRRAGFHRYDPPELA